MSRMARWPYLAVFAGIVLVDQLAKLAVERLMQLHESRTLIDGLLSLTYVRNRGAAFGILSDAELPGQPVWLALVGLAALAAILTYAARLPPDSHLPRLALALVVGGAVGNLIDRARLGYVIDFVDAYWRHHHWPAFNVADSAISVGVALLVFDMLRGPRRREEDAMAGAATSGGGD